ncbi:MAG: alanine racemase [Paenibacillaceae bacterium]|nr:alanine racemase [Paenibacillaceae bacterium]
MAELADKHALETPFVCVDLDIAERNITRMQAIAIRNGVALRPHAKTHKSPAFARMQIAAGAIGVTAAKLSEAEALVSGVVDDVLIAYPLIGAAKAARAAKLAGACRLTVAIDSERSAADLSAAAAREGTNIDIVVEFDCGFGRVGVVSPDEAVRLARFVQRLPGLTFRGLSTFAGQAYDAADEEQLRRIGHAEGRAAVDMADRLRAAGLPVDVVSVGSTPSAPFAAEVAGVTEIRPGAYLFGDLMQVKLGAHRLEDCALTVVATVVSRPGPGRAVIDAGTKLFTSDGEDSPLGSGRASIVGRSGITLRWLTEEHGMLSFDPESESLEIGDRLELVPNHCCGVVSMTDEIVVTAGGRTVGVWPVPGRGKVT